MLNLIHFVEFCEIMSEFIEICKILCIFLQLNYRKGCNSTPLREQGIIFEGDYSVHEF